MRGVTMTHFLRAALVPLLLLSCAKESAHEDASSALPGDSFAQVDGRLLSTELLGRKHRIDPENVLFDVLLAEEARRTLPHRAHSAERGVLARALLEEFREDELGRREITEQQLLEERKAKWRLFERPRAVRSVSVFVPVEELAPERPARELAEKLRLAAEGALSLEELSERLKAVPLEEGASYVPRRNPPLDAEGKSVPLLGHDDPSVDLGRPYGRALSKLKRRGEVTEVLPVEKGFVFGYAQEIVPPLSVPLDAARTQLLRGLVAPMVSKRSQAITEQGKKKAKLASKDVDALLGLVWRRK